MNRKLHFSQKVEQNRSDFLESFRLGIDFGDKAHGVALVKGNEVLLAVTLLDESKSDLSKRRQLRRGRRTRESRRQRLARLRQWCLRNHLPDPDPYFNKEIANVLWPPDRNDKPTSALNGLSKDQRKACHKTLFKDKYWQQFLKLPPDIIKHCALVNPFIARRLSREGKATTLIFVRALWHLVEHRGFDWYNRIRGEQEEDMWENKGALLKYIKTLVLPNDQNLEQYKEDIRKRDTEATEKSKQAKPWLDDQKVIDELNQARERGKNYPINRRLNPPRHYVEKELQECLKSFPLGQLSEKFGQKNGQDPLSNDEKREAVFRSLTKILNWNRREPRFDNRQLRGCTWCAATGIFRNTPRKKNILEWQIKAAIRDIKVASSEPLKSGKSTRKQTTAANAATRWLDTSEYNGLEKLILDTSLTRDELKNCLNNFFKSYAKLPKQVFVKEGQTVKKTLKPTDPYQWHREELLNLADGWRYEKTHGKEGLKAKGRSRLCVHCLKKKASTHPDELQPPVGEAEVILSQRALKARCDRLASWIKRNIPRAKYPAKFIRIEAVLPRPEEKARLKAEATAQEADQSPKAKLKFRLMEELGTHCNTCEKPYIEQERKWPKSDPDTKKYCQCPKPDLYAPCSYCLKQFPAHDLQIEHIYPKHPISREGGIGPDVQINKTVACEECNQRGKKERLPFDYFRNIVGGSSWQEWKQRVKSFKWSPTKRTVALLEEYKLPEDLSNVALARTGLVHRYLRQRLTALYFPEQTATLKDKKSDRESKDKAKAFLDWHMSTPAGWMTSKCRLDWEHETRNGKIVPLVPRKSPLRTPEERQKALEKRLREEPEKKHQDIRRGFEERAPIEDALLEEGTAVCDRTNLNQHWIDAAVLASLPPQANQPVELGGVWFHQNKEVRADTSFAPRAAEYLKKFGDGAVVYDIQNRAPRFTAQQQKTRLYGKYQTVLMPKDSKEQSKQSPLEKALINSKLLQEQLPKNIFEIFGDKNKEGKDKKKLKPISLEARNELLEESEQPENLKKFFEIAYNHVECHKIYEPIEKICVKHKNLIVSDYWRAIFKKLCNKKYDFPKKRNEQDADNNDGGKAVKTERREPEKDETIPPQGWKDWAADETKRLREEARRNGKNEEDIDNVRLPRHLKIYFKLSANEKVNLESTQKRSKTKRGIKKPERINRMTSVGSFAVFDPDSATLKVLLNPWKAHIEHTDTETTKGLKIFKGDCIWLKKDKKTDQEDKKTDQGWYRVTEMSPAKSTLKGEKEANLKLVPAWLDLNQLVQDAKAKEPDKKKRKKIGRHLWEKDIHAVQLESLAKFKELKIRRKEEVFV